MYLKTLNDERKHINESFTPDKTGLSISQYILECENNCLDPTATFRDVYPGLSDWECFLQNVAEAHKEQKMRVCVGLFWNITDKDLAMLADLFPHADSIGVQASNTDEETTIRAALERLATRDSRFNEVVVVLHNPMAEDTGWNVNVFFLKGVFRHHWTER